MDGKGSYFPPEMAFLTLLLRFIKYFSLIVPLTRRVNNNVSRQGEGIKRRSESTKTQMLLLLCITEDKTQYR